MTRHIFISYSHADKSIMQEVRGYLIKLDFDVWTDEEIGAGETWAQQVSQAIEQSQCVLALLSPDAKYSEWVNIELQYAKMHGIRIIPLLIHETPQASVPLVVMDLQWVDARSDLYTSVKKAISVLPNPDVESYTRLSISDTLELRYLRHSPQIPDLFETETYRTSKIAAISKHLANHFQKHIYPQFAKALVIASSNSDCALYKAQLDQHVPSSWSCVFIAVKRSDPPMLQQFKRDAAMELGLLSNFRSPRTDPHIIITTERLLTGFDAPIVAAVYLDRQLKQLMLAQALSQLFKESAGKRFSIIVDYVGASEEIHRLFHPDDAAKIVEINEEN